MTATLNRVCHDGDCSESVKEAAFDDVRAVVLGQKSCGDGKINSLGYVLPFFNPSIFGSSAKSAYQNKKQPKQKQHNNCQTAGQTAATTLYQQVLCSFSMCFSFLILIHVGRRGRADVRFVVLGAGRCDRADVRFVVLGVCHGYHQK